MGLGGWGYRVTAWMTFYLYVYGCMWVGVNVCVMCLYIMCLMVHKLKGRGWMLKTDWLLSTFSSVFKIHHTNNNKKVSKIPFSDCVNKNILKSLVSTTI